MGLLLYAQLRHQCYLDRMAQLGRLVRFEVVNNGLIITVTRWAETHPHPPDQSVLVIAIFILFHNWKYLFKVAAM